LNHEENRSLWSRLRAGLRAVRWMEWEETARNQAVLWREVTENEISKETVDAAIRIYRGLGPGLFESLYEGVMASALDGL
jgi:hypothetical protein